MTWGGVGFAGRGEEAEAEAETESGGELHDDPGESGRARARVGTSLSA
jgi:hypothetical protein